MTAVLADGDTHADLTTFLARAKTADPDGAARLVGHGAVLAVYVSPVHGGAGPTVLGLRTLALHTPSDLDVTVPLAALTDRLARAELGATLPVPPVQATGVGWAGVSPPRAGWQPQPALAAGELRRAAQQGIEEIAAGTPDGAGAHAVTRLRAAVWGRPAVAGRDDVPAGAAFTALVLGFLPPEDVTTPDVPVFRAGPWVRLSTPRGHVLARRPLT